MDARLKPIFDDGLDADCAPSCSRFDIHDGTGISAASHQGVTEHSGSSRHDDRKRTPPIMVACFAVLVSLIFVLVIPAVTPPVTFVEDVNAVDRSYAPHATIAADDDSELAALAIENGWPGDGSQGDPYIIDGYSINATGSKQAILIGNTTAHFVISGCYLSSASETGILLLNSTNGTLRNNTCMSNVWNGIAVVNSESVNVTNNSCQGSHYGILVQSSHSSSLMNNSCQSNGDGILVRQSDDNEIVGNTCDLNDGDDITDFGDGIRLLECDRNQVVDNLCSMNVRYQIRLEYSNDCTLERDRLVDSPAWSGAGLLLYYSNYIDIRALVLSSCSVFLEYSSFNEITNCSGGSISLRLSSSWNVVSGNNCSGSGFTGITVYRSNNNSIVNNTCSHMTVGLSLESSSDNIIIGNICTYNSGRYISMGTRPLGYGILATESRGNVYTFNNCSHTKLGGSWGAYGISISSLGEDLVSDNIVTYNDQYGIYVGGPSTIVRNNTVEHNGGCGLHFGGIGCLLEHNVVRWNADGGIYVSADDSTIVNNSVQSNAGLGISASTAASGNVYRYNSLVDDGIFPNREGTFPEHADTTNTVNGRPVYHLISQDGGAVPSGAGQVILLLCTGIAVEDQNLSRADIGLTIDMSTECYVQNITCCYGIVGVSVYDSSSNSIMFSNLSGNIEAGLTLSISDGNLVSENGFFDNSGYGVIATGTLDRMWNNTFARNNGAGPVYDPAHNQAYNSGTNFWNKSSWGNYWSDWTSPDIDYDGIVDQPYPVAGYNSAKDYYPRTTPTVFIPIEPIPEFAPLTLALLVIVLIGVVSMRIRCTR